MDDVKLPRREVSQSLLYLQPCKYSLIHIIKLTTVAYVGRGWGNGWISGHVSVRWVGHCTQNRANSHCVTQQAREIYSLLAMVVISTFGHLLPAYVHTCATESGIILDVHHEYVSIHYL